MGQIITLPHKFRPYPYQQDLWNAYFKEGKKRIIQVVHRRAGKDKGSLNLAIAASQQRVGTYLYLLPTQKQARTVIWENIDNDGLRYLDHFPRELLAQEPKSTTMTIYFKNGSIFQLGGADYYDAYMGSNPVCVIFSEYALQRHNAWPFFDPIITRNNGTAIFNYTPRGHNHGYTLYKSNRNNPEWYVSCLTIDDTTDWDGAPLFTKEMVDKKRREGTEEAIIQQEYYCNFEACLPGAYYADQLKIALEEKRIKGFNVDQNIPVFTFWDLGLNDDMVIIFMQPVGDELRIFDAYSNNGKGIDFYWDIIEAKEKEHKIKYRAHWAPFDINKHELGTGLTTRQVAKQFGLFFKVVPRLNIADGIRAVRMIFPRLIFHDARCDNLLEALKSYHREYDDRYDTYKDKPVHDWSSHFADAMRYLCVTWKEEYLHPRELQVRQMKKFSVL